MDASEISTARAMLMAAMETGNQGQARTLLREIQAQDEDAGREFQMEIINAYGIML